jgi:dipeptidyl aminopeptidase/acylaminoacyl peptidase
MKPFWQWDVANRSRILTVSITFFFLLVASRQGFGAFTHPKGRPVTVADAIRMTKLGDPGYFFGTEPFNGTAQFSPDGKKFVIVFRKGNLEQNTNEYSLLLWPVAEIARLRRPTLLLRMSSSSNRAAIRDVAWLSDNETLAFLGEHPGESQQLYSLNIRTRLLQRITNHSTNLFSYSITPDGRAIAFVAEPPVKNVWNKTTTREGVVINGQDLHTIGAGQSGGLRDPFASPPLYFQRRGEPVRRIPTVGVLDRWGSQPLLSPTGRYLLLTSRVIEVPESWKQYSNAFVHKQATQRLNPGEPSWLKRFELIDTRTGRAAILVNAPCGTVARSQAIWEPDGRAVVISGINLPLEDAVGESRELRKSSVFSIEVEVPSGEMTEISHQPMTLLRWDPRSKSFVFALDKSDGGARPSPKAYFRKVGGQWREAPSLYGLEKRMTIPDIVVEEDLNTAPKVLAYFPGPQPKKVLLDLNPQFRELEFGREEEVHWDGGDSGEFTGGLYYPIDYVSGQRYPLVIQTHGFNPNRFWIDGPWTTAFAAQPLAGRGIMVLQVPQSPVDHGTPKEAEREVARFETAIDYLDRRGLVDRNRVGLLGFSRTCLHVKYALTHSSYNFAAASVTDGIDGGYFQYLLTSSSATFNSIYEGINGGTPWEGGLEAWFRRSSGFNVEKVRTPLRIMAENPEVAWFEWEWHAALVRMGKPVEMVMTKDGEHILQKPWERMVSQQGNVDWFAFWLKGEEDPDPLKRDQYKRWRRLRDQMESTR